MRTRLLALAFATALAPSFPTTSYAATSAGACTSLVGICAGGCGPAFTITVTVIGYGYGDAKCGDATAWCTTTGTLPECSGSAHVLVGGSFIRCLADPASAVTVAICTATAPSV